MKKKNHASCFIGYQMFQSLFETFKLPTSIFFSTFKSHNEILFKMNEAWKICICIILQHTIFLFRANTQVWFYSSSAALSLGSLSFYYLTIQSNIFYIVHVPFFLTFCYSSTFSFFLLSLPAFSCLSISHCLSLTLSYSLLRPVCALSFWTQ